MRHLITLCGLLLVASAAPAQVGPTNARAISRPMPAKAPSGVQSFTAEAELRVSKKGHIDSVEVVASSGDPAFDKEWKKSLSDWRFVPAVDAGGEPIESQWHVTYKNNSLSSHPSSAAGATPPNVIGESERLEHLTCKDFLWEYYIVTSALPRRLALMDPLLKTPLVMYAAEAHPSDTQQQTLRERHDQTVTEAAKQCRDNPDTPVWSGILKPALDASLAN